MPSLLVRENGNEYLPNGSPLPCPEALSSFSSSPDLLQIPLKPSSDMLRQLFHGTKLFEEGRRTAVRGLVYCLNSRT